MIPILILAAGQSSRMQGRDKTLETVQGKPLLRHMAMMACAVSDQVFVALPIDAPARKASLDGLPLTICCTPESREGMGATMRESVPKLPACPAFMVLLSDLPDLTADDLHAVISARENHPDHLIWRGATPDGRPGHPIIFDAALRPQFATLQGDSGGEPLVKPLKDRTYLALFEDDRARRDLDTPAAWAAWRADQTD